MTSKLKGLACGSTRKKSNTGARIAPPKKLDHMNERQMSPVVTPIPTSILQNGTKDAFKATDLEW
jgi:hypothetical protein